MREPIPEDVMQRAVRLVDDLDVDWTWDGCLSDERGKEEMQAATEIIARALMDERLAERARCVKVATDKALEHMRAAHADSDSDYNYNTGRWAVCNEVANKIRGQP